MKTTLITDPSYVNTTIARHAGFWNRTGHGSCLRYTGLYSQSSPISLPQPDGRQIIEAERVEPAMISPDDMIRRIENYSDDHLNAELALKGEYLVNVGQGDFLPLALPLMKFPWIEAMMGCPVKITEGQIWDTVHPGDPEEIATDTTDFRDNPWFELYIEFLKMLQDRLSERFFISASSNQRGVSDLAAAIMGASEAATGWLDRPEFMRRLLRRCTDAVLAVVEASNRVVQPLHGGYACKWGVWSSDKVVCTQADHASFVSPEVYREQILPFDREVLASSPKSVIHLHNNGLHHAPALMDLPELDAIQVWVDPYPSGDRLTYEVEMLHRIMEHKPLILDVYPPRLEESEWLFQQLPKQGLFFKVWLDRECYSALPEDYPGTDPWLRR